jgi:hypothetical protein
MSHPDNPAYPSLHSSLPNSLSHLRVINPIIVIGSYLYGTPAMPVNNRNRFQTGRPFNFTLFTIHSPQANNRKLFIPEPHAHVPPPTEHL